MRLDELRECLGWEGERFDTLYAEFCELESAPSTDHFMAWLRARDHVDLGAYTRLQDQGEVEVKELDALTGKGPQQGSDPYDFLAEVGHGAMGEVFLALEQDLGRRVAIKRLHEGETKDSIQENFYREAQITAQLEHPCIVPIYRLGLSDGGKLSYSMKLIHGDTMELYLEEILEAQRAGKPLKVDQQLAARLRLLLKVCDALSYAHSRGVIHRDLKPANIMIGRYNQVYVMDWGIARRISVPDADLNEAEGLAVGDGDIHLGETQFGIVMGTPAYMAPEQANGEQEIMGAWSDQYALGLILQELITLEQANPGPDAESRVMHAMAAWRRPLESTGKNGVPRELAGIIMRACARRPENRYPSVEAMASDILRYLDGLEVQAAPDSRVQGLARWLSRNRQKTMLLFVGLLVILFASSTLSLYKEQQNEAELRRQEQLRVQQKATAEAREAQQKAEAEAREKTQAEAAALRQEALGRLLTRVALKSHEIDTRFLEYEGLVQSLSAATLQSLIHEPVGTEDIYLAGDYESGNGPEDLRFSSRYLRELSLAWPVFKFAPGVDARPLRGVLHRLSTLRHTMRVDMLRSAGEETLGLSREEAEGRVLNEGVPLVWSMVGLEQGIHMGYPGKAGYGADFDPRQRPWYLHASKKNEQGRAVTGPQWTAPYSDALGMGLMLSCVMGIYEPGGDFLGVAGMDVALEQVISELMGLEGLSGVYSTYLLDSHGRVVVDSSASRHVAVQASAEELPEFSEAEVVRAVQGGYSGHVESWTQRGVELVIYYRLDSLGWFYVVRGDAENLMGMLDGQE